MTMPSPNLLSICIVEGREITNTTLIDGGNHSGSIVHAFLIVLTKLELVECSPE